MSDQNKNYKTKQELSKKKATQFIVKESFKGIRPLEDIFTDIVFSEYKKHEMSVTRKTNC